MRHLGHPIGIRTRPRRPWPSCKGGVLVRRLTRATSDVRSSTILGRSADHLTVEAQVQQHECREGGVNERRCRQDPVEKARSGRRWVRTRISSETRSPPNTVSESTRKRSRALGRSHRDEPPDVVAGQAARTARARLEIPDSRREDVTLTGDGQEREAEREALWHLDSEVNSPKRRSG